LIVPTASTEVGMEVGGQVVHWNAGEPVFFDDSYEHNVWNHTKEERVLLLFDLWHPELDELEIDAIKDMFSHARDQGWIKK
jgi:aspartate beta-hydroxylase